MGNIICGPFEETTLCCDKAPLNDEIQPTCSVSWHLTCVFALFCPSYNLPRSMWPLNNFFSPSMGWIQARHLVGLWRGKFTKWVLITLLEKPTTKTHKCKMETDGWLQFSIYFSGMGVNVVPCRCSKGSCCSCKTLVSITVGRNMEHIHIWLKQSWQSIGLWECLFFIPCFHISLSSLELKFSLMKSYCSLSYGQSLLLGIGIASLSTSFQMKQSHRVFIQDNKGNKAHMFRRALCALQTGEAENDKSDIFHVSL